MGKTEPNPMISPMAIQAMAAHDPRLMTGGHGHVIPRPDGSKAPCAGPSGCRECYLEFVACQTTARLVIWEGWKLQPGDRVLLLAPMDMPQWAINKYGEDLVREFPDIGFTIVKGFTGLQVHRQDPSEGYANS